MRNCLLMVFADAHLDECIWTGRRDIRGDSKAAFQYLVGRAIEMRPQWLICAGDLLDSVEPPSSVISFLNKQLMRLQGTDVRFGFVQGNHDYAIPSWADALQLKHVQHLHRYRFELEDGSVCRGMDWQPADKLLQEAGSLTYQDAGLLICHQAWAEFMGESRCEGCLADLPVGADIVTGDFHETRSIMLQKVHYAGAVRVISPGATHLRTIAEPTEHFYFTLHADGWKKRRIPGRPIQRERLGHETSFDWFLDDWPKHLEKLREQGEKVPAAIVKPLVIVDFVDEIPQAAQRLRKRLGDDAFLIARSYKRPPEGEEELQRQSLDKQHRQELLSQGLVAGLYHRLGPEHAHYRPLVRLLESADPAEELLAMKQERGL